MKRSPLSPFRAGRDAGNARSRAAPAARVCGTRSAMPRICASVPYSSSMPWIASTGQRMASSSASMFHCLKGGCSQMRFQPQKAESDVVVVAAQLLRQVGLAGRPARACSMLATVTSSTKMCGASTTRPATRSGKRAAYSSEIEPPSLWPKSQGFSVEADGFEEGRQHLVRLAVHEVDVPGLVGLARRRAAVAGAREHQAAEAAGLAQALGEVLPHRDRAEAFVQEDDAAARRCVPARCARIRCARRAPASRWRRTRASARHALLLPLAQPEALDLAGGRLRQLVDELDEARVLVGREPLLHEGLELVVARPPGPALRTT